MERNPEKEYTTKKDEKFNSTRVYTSASYFVCALILDLLISSILDVVVGFQLE